MTDKEIEIMQDKMIKLMSGNSNEYCQLEFNFSKASKLNEEDFMIIIKTNAKENDKKFKILSKEEEDRLYNIIIEKEKDGSAIYIEEIISEIDNLEIKNLSNNLKTGMHCSKCNENYPYAEHKDNFICWSCRNF